jgi:hypothetical protein
VRFTQRPGSLYAIVPAAPDGSDIVLNDLHLASATDLRLLGYGMPPRWQQRGAQVAVELPGDVVTGPAYTLGFSPQPP